MTNKQHQTKTDYGKFWNGKICTSAGIYTEANFKGILDMQINRNPGGGAPELTGDWEDYKVVVVMRYASDLSTEQVVDGATPPTELIEEPDIDMVYMYSFFYRKCLPVCTRQGCLGQTLSATRCGCRRNPAQAESW